MLGVFKQKLAGKTSSCSFVGLSMELRIPTETERITQLNRPLENNMLKQIEYLTSNLYNQLGMTEAVFNGTADEKTLLNYHNRTIEPILSAIAQAMKRSFLTKTARSQGQSIEFFRDPFKNISISKLVSYFGHVTN